MLSSTVKYTILGISWLIVMIAFWLISLQLDFVYAVILLPITLFVVLFVIFKVVVGSQTRSDIKKVEDEGALSYTPIHVPAHTEKDKFEVADEDRRMFIKLLGSTGLFLFIYSILNRNSDRSILNKLKDSRGLGLFGDMSGGQNSQMPQIPSQPQTKTTDDYKIAEIDDNVIAYFGYIDQDGGWYIMRADSETGSIRYIKGDANFARSWENRENLDYKYYHEVF